MAGATRLALLHLFHGGAALGIAVGIQLGVAVIAAVGCRVKVMAEVANNGASGVLKGQVYRLVTYMALVAVTAGSKGGLAVVADAAGLALFHLGHGDLA